ncbi:MAG: ThiF family adenylyltransferase [Candidatus Woesearchaeota archaeon]
MDSIELRQDQLLLKQAQNEKDKKSILSNLKSFKNKKFILIGLGGVGSNCAELLVRSGCTNLVLIDADIIEVHNLGRQNYTCEQINIFKTTALEKNLLKIDPKAKIQVLNEYLKCKNYEQKLLDVINVNLKNIVIIDCSDNLDTRNLINSFCLKYNIDWMYSGGEGFESICALFTYSKNSNINSYNKLITLNHTQSANCSTGVLNSTTLITASLIVKELLLHCCLIQNQNMISSNIDNGGNNNKVKCIKFNSLHNSIFEFYI